MNKYLLALLLGLWTSALALSSTPVFVPKGIYPDAAGDLIEEIAVVGDYAYLANGFSGLRILNISNPATPLYVGGEDTPYLARSVAVDSHYAYIADWGSLAFHVIDVTDPSHPIYKGSYGPGRKGIDVAVLGQYAYLADYHSGVIILDVTDAEHPTQTSWFSMNRCNALALQSGYVFAAGIGSGLSIIDVRDPIKPVLACNYKNGTFDVHEVTVSGNFAYLIGIDETQLTILDIVDVKDVNHPKSVGQLELSGGYFLATTANYVVVGDTSSPLHLIDASDPSAPMAVSTYYGQHPSAKNTKRPRASGGLIYWPVGEYGMEIVSIEQAPALSISPMISQGMVQVIWDKGLGIKLQRTQNLANPLWEDVVDSSGDGIIPVSKSEANCFFRVVKEKP